MKPAWKRVVRTGRADLAFLWARFDRNVLTAASSLLDIGSGDSPAVAEVVAAGVFGVALDPQYAVDPPRWTGASAIAARAEALPFRDLAFDTVVATYALQHCTRPHRALLEMLRVTAIGGHVAVHPAWRPGAIAAFEADGAVRVNPGRRVLSRRRPSVELMAGLATHQLVAAHPRAWRDALRPRQPVRAIGWLAMAMVITLRGDSRIEIPRPRRVGTYEASGVER